MAGALKKSWPDPLLEGKGDSETGNEAAGLRKVRTASRAGASVTPQPRFLFSHSHGCVFRCSCCISHCSVKERC